MTKITRRNFLKITGATIAVSVVSVTGFLAIQNEAEELTVVKLTIPIKNLKSSLEGFKIVQMTDFHLYPYTRPELVVEAVRICNQLRPDLTVLTGDYVWQEVEAVFALAPILAGLDARHGVYSIMGNHDLWADVNVIQATFDQYRLPVLTNQGLPITIGNGTLYLAGLDDGWSGQPDLAAALEGAPTNAPVVLLFHEPDLADQVSLDGRVALQLAGHTHGGQVRLPGYGAFILPYLGRKYDLGLYQVNGMWLYTNAGIGMISLPVRYNCPPEITEFTLVQA